MVAWHEVPGNAHTEIRPVGNGVIGLSPSVFILLRLAVFLEGFSDRGHAKGVPSISYRSLRGRARRSTISRHFVPGYHHTVPSGQTREAEVT